MDESPSPAFKECFLLDQIIMIFSLFAWLVIFSLFLIFGDVPALSSDFHNLCLEKLHFSGSLGDIYRALVCGKRLPVSPVKSLFVQGGLIHLTVVSGAHLLFLERFWKKLPFPVLLKTHGIFFLLIVYALASHFHPPVVRALFAFFLHRLSSQFKLFWSTRQIILLSGILCLIYQPAWVYSLSLQLSLLACFLQTMSPSLLKRSFFTYLFLLPIVNRWQALHPFTVLIHWILAPLIGTLLFPFSFLSPFFPFLYPISDFLWSGVLKLLKIFQFFPSQSPLMTWFIPEPWIWPYFIFVYFCIFNKDLLKRHFFIYPKKSQ